MMISIESQQVTGNSTFILIPISKNLMYSLWMRHIISRRLKKYIQNSRDDGLIDVIGFLKAFGRLQDQKRELDNIKRLNLSIADQNENLINITLWGDCAEETYGKKHEDMEPPIVVLIRFARLNRNTDYGHLSNAFNATLVTLNPNIAEATLSKERLSQDSGGSQLFSQISNVEYPTYSPESLLSFRTRISLSDVAKLDQECDVVTKVTIQKCETLYGWVYDACPCDKKPEYQSNGSLKCTKCDKEVLMTVPKYKVHYKVYDNTGKCSVIFFDRHATELLGKSASKMKEDMHQEGRNSTIPKELDEIAGKVVIVKLRVKSHNIKHRTSSIGVSQFCGDNHVVQQFKYSNEERIDELHMAYLPLQYPLLFPYGDNGFDSTNEHSHASLATTKKKKKLTPREYLAFRLMRRKSEISVILHAKKLLQQFIVDGYAMVESDRLDYIKKHQKELRVDLYSGLSDAVTRGEMDPLSTGRRVILPSSFTGGARYMIQNYQDAMAICAWAGYPDIFITFTCNPMWPKLPVIDEKIFGSVTADVYTIEFQKRGLPHAHIILWLSNADKLKTPSSRSAPCMKDGKCSKFFPKRYCQRTTLDENGYPTYRRRDDGCTVSRKGVQLDNDLFYLIMQGNDRVIAGIYSNKDNSGSQQSFDEISHYLNCRYVSSCEASWRIFGFDIHHRHPPVERLSFHLPHQQSVYYTERESMSSLVTNPRVKESMFLAWFEKNKDDPFARTLTYSQFPNFFTFVREKRLWKTRERGFSVGRIGHCTPAQGELYYLRLLLTKVRGPKNYTDIRTVNNVVFPTFREACYAYGLLDDDNEYIDAIKEASLWASGNYLRQFFTSMLLSHCLSQHRCLGADQRVYL
ncbi:hypothetical protein K1719_014310 [Acacia pycnantha]|nr:hypothetical protein K1719_014310 [Acacia pycnantha]